MPKRKCCFNDDYTKEWDFIRRGEQEHEATCRLCSCTFSIGHGGKADIVQHIQTKKHKNQIPVPSSSKPVSSYFLKRHSDEDDKVTAAEMTMAYHTIKHHQSFSSSDCNNKLFSTIFPDSKIAEKCSSARTKCTALIKNVIAPQSVKHVITVVKNEANFYGISTDASNHNNEKIFPVTVQYFTPKSGMEIKLIKVSSLANETSDAIVELCTTTLESYELDVKKCVAFCGDNCNTNFGGRQRLGTNNVFYKLKTTLNGDMEGIGCPAHLLHNTMRTAADTLSVDVEVIVMKIFSHFSTYTVRNERLKDFCEFVGVKYQTIVSHSKTRWLSLSNAIERILKLFPALKSYFLLLEHPPKILFDFFSSPLSECYLNVVHSVLHALKMKILEIEGGDKSTVDVLATLKETEKIFKERHDANFIPISVKTLIKSEDILPEKAEEFLSEVQRFYKIGYDYLRSWMDALNKYDVYSWMKLNSSPTWQQLEESCLALKEKNVGIDDNELFTEWSNLREFVTNELEKNKENWTEISTQHKWVRYLSACELKCQYTQLLIICQYVFSIPAHNAHVERIFSTMSLQWTKERNRLELSTVEAILQILVNERKSCSEFYSSVLEDKNFLKIAKSSNKY